MIANVSSDDGGLFGQTVVSASEHPSLTHPSYVRAELAKLTGLGDIQRAATTGLLYAQADASEALVLKLQTELVRSPHAKREVTRALTDHFSGPPTAP